MDSKNDHSSSDHDQEDLRTPLILTPITQNEHELVIKYLDAQKLLRNPNHQFDSNLTYFVLLFGPTSYIEKFEWFQQKLELTRDQYVVLKSLLTVNGSHTLSKNHSNTANEESVPNVRPRISSTQRTHSNNHSSTVNNESVPNVPRRMSYTKSRDNEPVTIPKNCNELCYIDTSDNSGNTGFRRSRQVKSTNDDPVYRDTDDSDGSDESDDMNEDNISVFIPEEDASIDSEDLSDDDNLSDCTQISQKNKNRAPKKKKPSTSLKTIKKKKPSSSRQNRNKSPVTRRDNRSTFDPPQFVSDLKDRQMTRKFEVVARRVEEFQTATTWENPIDQQQKPKFQLFLVAYDELVHQPPKRPKFDRISSWKRREGGQFFFSGA